MYYLIASAGPRYFNLNNLPVVDCPFSSAAVWPRAKLENLITFYTFNSIILVKFDKYILQFIPGKAVVHEANPKMRINVIENRMFEDEHLNKKRKVLFFQVWTVKKLPAEISTKFW